MGLILEFGKELQKVIKSFGYTCEIHEMQQWISLIINRESGLGAVEYEADFYTPFGGDCVFQICCGSVELFSTTEISNPNFTAENVARIIINDFNRTHHHRSRRRMAHD
jgi:hypothetical protein